MSSIAVQLGNPPARSVEGKDFIPLIDRNTTNGLCQAETVRDNIYGLFEEVARARGVQVLILRSDPYVSPPWVRVECWVRHPRDPSVTLRSKATITVRPREFHRFPCECDIELINDKKKHTILNVINFQRADAEKILAYLLEAKRSTRPKFRRRRSWGLDLWRPKNKAPRLGVDVTQVLVSLLAILGVMTLAVGVGALLLLAAGILAYFNSRRRTHVLSAGRPLQEPRRLIRLDSWQVVVDGLGDERDAIRAAIASELAAVNGQAFEVTHERIWYWGSDGKEEREQTVVRLKRGLLFLHLYKYGQGLFVGWDAHVNCGEWIEVIAGKGYDKSVHELCAVHSIKAGWHTPNEYDITDANCLIEQVHAILSRCVKLKIAEQKIDQEIDFKIVREARKGIAGSEEPKKPDDGGGLFAGVRSRLKRLS